MDQFIPFITEALRADGKLWVVIAVIAVVLLGWMSYLLRIGSRIRKVKNRIYR